MASDNVQLGFISKMPIVIGIMMTLSGPVVFGGFAAFLFHYDTDAPPSSALVGTIDCSPSHSVPVGEPACAAHVRVTGVRSSGKNRYVTLSNTFVGERDVKVSGKRLRLPEYHRDRWIACAPDYERFASLDHLVGVPSVERDFPGYSVTVWAFRGGEQVVVDARADGRIRRVWCGDRESVADRNQAYRRDIVILFGGAGLAISFLGAVVLGLGLFARRRRESSRPTGAASAAEWGAWTLSQRSAKYSGEYRGFPVTIQRIYRRRSEGPVRLELTSATSRKVTWVRRSGGAGLAGRALDKAAGMALRDGEAFGYPDFEIAMSDEQTQVWLRRETVRFAVNQLATNDAGANIVSISIQPDRILLTLANPASQAIDTMIVERWLGSLARLAGETLASDSASG